MQFMIVDWSEGSKLLEFWTEPVGEMERVERRLPVVASWLEKVVDSVALVWFIEEWKEEMTALL